MKIYAHSKPNAPLEEWQSLEAHLNGVAKRAAEFADSFSSAKWGRLIGLLHDIGKSRKSFQSYLLRCNEVEDADPDYGDHSHSGAGGCWIWQNAGAIGKALSYCIVGHHGGLPDWSGGEKPDGALVRRLESDQKVLEEAQVRLWNEQHESDCCAEIGSIPFNFSRYDSSLSFWIRMMYSCLVDADFLDTESFMDVERSGTRQLSVPLSTLSERFFEKLNEKQKAAAETPVNKIRAEIRSACESAANSATGIFSLTVPTGGGKTLSGTAFAFKHALKHGLKRIIYVIPYTSIIEQTADILRDFLGEENVIEHHSNLDPEKETKQSRLASENWDAPVIVTTAVQFFESLYACRSSQCRKLHNIAESVVILDEVQLLPTSLLLPCAEAIRQLTQHYRTSIVLSTATQSHFPGVDSSSIREIIPSSLDLYKRLKRTNIEFPKDLTKRCSWDEIAAELQSHNQVLCVVNTRRDCYELFRKMPEGTIHLSASMCGEHRSRVIAEIKCRLSDNEPIRVISTQLVEAGVDIDFPIVYRAFAGLSSVAQSAGRCNREGKLEGLGRVVVFMPPRKTPIKDLRDGEYAMQDLLIRPKGIDVDDFITYPEYFKSVHKRAHDLGSSFGYWLGVPIPKDYMNGADCKSESGHYQFREAASAFKMIDGASQQPIIVRYVNSDDLIESLRVVGPKRDIMRKLQRYTVNVPRGRVKKLLENGMIEEIGVPTHHDEPSGIFVQTTPSAYRDDVGLDMFGLGLQIEDFLI